MILIRARRPWVRHHPLPRKIAAAMLAQPALLSLSTGLLVTDVRTRYDVSPCTAKTAVAIARGLAA